MAICLSFWMTAIEYWDDVEVVVPAESVVVGDKVDVDELFDEQPTVNTRNITKSRLRIKSNNENLEHDFNACSSFQREVQAFPPVPSGLPMKSPGWYTILIEYSGVQLEELVNIFFSES